MHSYSVRDVERVLQLSRGTLRGLIEVGFVRPARGPRREYRFSFQDMIVLRAARTLIQANVPRRRIRRSLQELRRHLPETLPMSGLSIGAIGERVVVREGNTRFQADDGQYLLGLEVNLEVNLGVSLEDGMLRIVDRLAGNAPAEKASARGAQPVRDPAQFFFQALSLEDIDAPGALRAYRQAVDLDPGHLAAWINRGRLLHELNHTREADQVYEQAVRHCGPDALLLFNRGVLMEDLGRIAEALAYYHSAIEEDPMLADCHYNLARLYEGQGKPQHAIRHLGEYRRLTAEPRR